MLLHITCLHKQLHAISVENESLNAGKRDVQEFVPIIHNSTFSRCIYLSKFLLNKKGFIKLNAVI